MHVITVKPAHIDFPYDPQLVAVADCWLLSMVSYMIQAGTVKLGYNELGC